MTYLAGPTAALVDAADSIDPSAIHRHVGALVTSHDRWRDRESLNLNPAESSVARHVRELLASDLCCRVSEGLPGAKIYPRGVQNRFVDEIEAIVISLAKKLFKSRFVEWRPVSTSMANAAAFLALLTPGNDVVVQSEDGGGNYSYQPGGTLGLLGARIHFAPHARDGRFSFDLPALSELVDAVRPQMIVIGGSNVIDEYPLREIRAMADRVGALVLFDAAHLGLLVAHGLYQDPLACGAHLMTVSTHKVMGGPVGGMILTNDQDIAARIGSVVFPGLLQTRDQNKYAALASSLADALHSGAALARLMVDNACELGRQLERRNLNVISAIGQYSRTHQLFVHIGQEADRFEANCHRCQILLASCMLEDDASARRRTGLRISTQELTRRGMTPTDMALVAELICDAAIGEDAAVSAKVRNLLGRYPLP